MPGVVVRLRSGRLRAYPWLRVPAWADDRVGVLDRTLAGGRRAVRDRADWWRLATAVAR